RRPQPGLHGREHHTHERRAREQPMYEPDRRAQQPAGATQSDEDHVVAEREHQPGHEMQGVPEHACARAVLGPRGTEQERDVHPRDAQRAGRRQRRREDEGADESPEQRGPRAHDAIGASATAALTSARCTRPWGKLPRNSPPAGSISSAYSPTSFAKPISSSIRRAASSRRPAMASASASQNEQQRNAPSPPARPSSPVYR